MLHRLLSRPVRFIPKPQPLSLFIFHFHPHAAAAFSAKCSCSRRQRKIVTLSLPNSETGGSVSDIDVPNRLKSKEFLGNASARWLIKKNTEETEYPSLDGGHTLIKETKVTVAPHTLHT